MKMFIDLILEIFGPAYGYLWSNSAPVDPPGTAEIWSRSSGPARVSEGAIPRRRACWMKETRIRILVIYTLDVHTSRLVV